VAELGVPLAVIYSCAAAGSLIGGGVSTLLLRAGYPLGRVRKGLLLASALLATPIAFALHAETLWGAVAVLGLTLAAHQGFSTNLFALISDVVPAARVGTVTSIGALAGNLAGMNILFWAGVLLAHGYGYGPLFWVVALSYLAALGWVQLLLPRLGSASTFAPAGKAL
jgi:MFS transporter, ACS family, hexuronate transporter